MVLGFGAVGALGCKQEDPTIAAKDYPQEMAVGYCTAVYSCTCTGYPYANFNECLTDLSVAYDKLNDDAFLSGLAYDGSCPAKELERIDSYECKNSIVESSICIPPCNAWYGPFQAGSLCEVVAFSPETGKSFSTCAQGLSCMSGVCVNPCQLVTDLPGLGQPCPDYLCDTGATCDITTQICVALPTLPGPGEPCQAGVCDPARAICIAAAGICAALPSVGQPCVEGLCDTNGYCGMNDVCLAKPAYACGLLGGSVPGDGDGDPTTGDGDGDPTTTGDGDGDPTTTGDGDGDPGSWPCADGVNSIPIEWVCDGGADCPDNSDEIAGCGDPGFFCGDGLRIPSSYVCDGFADCADGSDELAC